MVWLYIAFYPQSFWCCVKNLFKYRKLVIAIDTCLHLQESKTILESHDSHSKYVALLPALL